MDRDCFSREAEFRRVSRRAPPRSREEIIRSALSDRFNEHALFMLNNWVKPGQNVVVFGDIAARTISFEPFRYNYAGFEKELDRKCVELRREFPALRKIVPNRKEGMTFFLNKEPSRLRQFLCAALH